MKTQIESIAKAKTAWDAMQPLSPENERRLWQKLRLEWNYHSNNIEGNTLTYGETELLLIHGATHGNHILREYQEMQAHDLGIAHLRDLAEDRTRFIGETDIRNLNKIILKEPFWKPAQTADGQASRKQIIPGEYKTTPNNVLTATGELFEFAAPLDVPAKMQALVQWLVHALSAENPPILPILAKLHHDFVLIHPFDDGNGRVARMLVNYVLMRQGFPPIIVPTERKRDYLNALRLADAGDITELESFLGTCVVRSLELGIKAAKGESLDEPGDVEKEIVLYAREHDLENSKVIPASNEVLIELYKSSFKELFDLAVTKMATLDPLFLSHRVSGSAENVNHYAGYMIEEDVHSAFATFLDQWDNSSPFIFSFSFGAFRGKSERPFDYSINLSIEFEHAEYKITMNRIEVIRKLYTRPILSDEREEIANKLLARAFREIRESAANPG